MADGDGRDEQGDADRSGCHRHQDAGRGGTEPVTLIVDGANVMGSRADGWWRDRARAMLRLHAELAALAERGIGVPPPAQIAPSLPADEAAPRAPWFPSIILVVEGKARAAAERVEPGSPVRVVAARGEGDEEIAKLAARVPGRRIVVTADQELRRRCQQAGADVAGPRWLTRLLA